MINETNKEQVADSNGAQTEITTNITTLLEAAKPLIKYLNDNHHPMCTAIVTLTSVEILEGIKCETTDEFIKD